jgi:hypothetical protein
MELLAVRAMVLRRRRQRHAEVVQRLASVGSTRRWRAASACARKSSAIRRVASSGGQVEERGGDGHARELG